MVTDHEFAYLTTTGRVSGKPHTIEIWYRRIDDVVWFIAGGGVSSDWVKNVIADPRVSVCIGDDVVDGDAFVDDQDAPPARRALAARYQGWQEGRPLSDWATHGMTVGVRLR